MTLIQYNIHNGVKSYLPAGDEYLTLIFSIFVFLHLVITVVWIVFALRGKGYLVLYSSN